MIGRQLSEDLGVPLTPGDVLAVESLEEILKEHIWLHDIQCNPMDKHLTIRVDLSKPLAAEAFLTISGVLEQWRWQGYRVFCRTANFS